MSEVQTSTPVVNVQAKYNLLALFAFSSVFVGIIPGIVLGHMALRDLKTSGERGRSLAVAAVVVGYVFLALFVAYCISGVIAGILMFSQIETY